MPMQMIWESALFSLPSTEGEEEVYAMRAEACANAMCDCTGVTLLLDPNSPSARARWSEDRVITVDVNPLKQEWTSFEEKEDPLLVEFGKSVAAEFSDEQWGSLAQDFFKLKQEAIKNVDPDATIVKFDFDEIERESLLVSYLQLFPYIHEFKLDWHGETLLIDDQYCVRSNCTCQNVRLTFLTMPDCKDVVSLIFDTSTSTWTDGRDRSIHGKALEIVKTLKVQHPTFLAEIRERQSIVQRIYDASKRELYNPSVTTIRTENRTGRNAPCPCGSGKKYKKCCANGSSSAV